MQDPNDKGGINDVKNQLTIIKSFTRIFQNTFSSEKNTARLAERYQNANKNKDDPYKTEFEIIQNLNRAGVIWGIGSGIASFIFLRQFPKTISRYMVKRQLQRNHQQSSSSVSSHFGAAANNTNSIPDASSMERRGGFFFRSVGLLFDVGLSFWMAVIVSFTMTDKRKCLEEVSKMPLVQGKSILAEELCADFIKQYYIFPNSIWKQVKSEQKQSQVGSVTDSMQWLISIQDFVRNCEKRQAYEKKLKQEEADFDLSSSSSSDQNTQFIAIPPPGVPEDFFLDSELEDETNFYDFEEKLHSDGFSSDSSWDSNK